MIKLALLSSIIPVVLVTAAWGLDKIVKRQETVSILVNYFNQVWSRGGGVWWAHNRLQLVREEIGQSHILKYKPLEVQGMFEKTTAE